MTWICMLTFYTFFWQHHAEKDNSLIGDWSLVPVFTTKELMAPTSSQITFRTSQWSVVYKVFTHLAVIHQKPVLQRVLACRHFWENALALSHCESHRLLGHPCPQYCGSVQLSLPSFWPQHSSRFVGSHHCWTKCALCSLRCMLEELHSPQYSHFLHLCYIFFSFSAVLTNHYFGLFSWPSSKDREAIHSAALWI